MHPKFRLFLLTSISLLVLDQLVKWWARAAAEGVEGRSIHSLWTGVFELKLVYNQGVAFGMLQGKGVYLAPIALIITAFAVYYSYKHKDEPKSHHVVLALLASGAVGNLIDRLAMGKVTDMFWFRLINFPVFNIADICISVAGAAFLLVSLQEMIKGKPDQQETEPTATPQKEDPRPPSETGDPSS